MKTVDLYHLVGLVALLLMVVCITLGANDGVVLVIGIGIIVILLLGVHLVLDKQDKRFCVLERRLEEVHYDAHFTKKQMEFGAGIRIKEQSVVLESLAKISLALNEMEREKITTYEIKNTLEEIKRIVEEISVKSPEKREQSE